MTPPSASPQPPPRRFAHLWFPRLPTDRLLRQAKPCAPQVVVETQKTALRLTAVDTAAADQGLDVGMTLSDARARVPGLVVAQADPAADLALLMRLAEACRRFTPALALQAPDGLDLDVTGCAPLFGGEARLLMAAGAVAQRAGLELRSALADTAALAYSAARFGEGGVVAVGQGAAVLAPLPIEALRLEAQGCTVLRQLGFKRIGQIMALPRAALSRRLGLQALHRLDEAMGTRASPLELSLEPPVFRAERRLFEPISEADQVMQVVGDLAADLAVQLEGRAVGGRTFALELFRVDGAVKRLCVAASRPLCHPGRIAALFAERLAGLNDGLQADFGFDQLRLAAERTQALHASATDLLQDTAPVGAVEALADRLAARSGMAAYRLAPADLHTPEAAETAAALDRRLDWAGIETFGTDRGSDPARFLDTPLRPLRLFRPPQPILVTAAGLPEGPPARFTWRRVTRTVMRAEGPERLEPEWARHPADLHVRDYYRLEDEAGRRYWVFRQNRYDAPEPQREAREREAIKPVRPPPKPESGFKLKLVTGCPPSPSGAGRSQMASAFLLPCEAGEGDPAQQGGGGVAAAAIAELETAAAATPPSPRFARSPPPASQGERRPLTPSTTALISREGSGWEDAAAPCLTATPHPDPPLQGERYGRAPAWFLHGLFG